MPGGGFKGGEMLDESAQEENKFGEGSALTVRNYISQVDSATNFRVIVQLILIGILLTIVSGCVAIVFILRYDPLRILSNRD